MIEKVKFSDYDNITEVIAEGLTDLRRKKDIISFLDIYSFREDFENVLFAIKSPVDGQYYLATADSFYLDDYGYDGEKVLIFMLKDASKCDYNELFPDRRCGDSFIMIDETPKIFSVLNT